MTSPWFAFPKKCARPQVRLVCFHHAGGSASAYRSWYPLVPAGVEVWPVQLPGRETRWKEPALTRLDEVVPPLLEALRPLASCPLIFFGHSLGSLVAFETARALRTAGLPLPTRLCVSAGPPPDVPLSAGVVDTLDDTRFLEYLKSLNGIPAEALEHQALLELMLPVLRADFRLRSGYRWREAPPLACPVTALGGLEDPSVSREDLAGWGRHTEQFDGVSMFPGDHFYLRADPGALLPVVLRQLSPLLAAGS